MCAGLTAAGWEVEVPKATMFLWAKIPEDYRHLGSLAFVKLLLQEAHVAVSPGCAFGERGDEYVRFALIQEESEIKAACQRIAIMLQAQVGLDSAQIATV